MKGPRRPLRAVAVFVAGSAALVTSLVGATGSNEAGATDTDDGLTPPPPLGPPASRGRSVVRTDVDDDRATARSD